MHDDMKQRSPKGGKSFSSNTKTRNSPKLMDASPRGAPPPALALDGADEARQPLSGAPPPPDAPSKLSASQGFKAALLVGVVVQNAALNIAARWSRVEAEAAFAETGCGAAATTVVLTVEVVKIAMALLLFALESGGVARACAELARVTREQPAECGKIAVPALIYVVQNNLLLVAAANLEGPVLALFGQLKILTTAVFSVALLGRTLGPRRWAALVALTAAIATVQVSQLRPAPESGDAGTKNVPLGLALTLVVATLSGFAGVYFEKVLKGSRISVWVRNVHLAAISSVVAGAAVASRDRGALAACGFFGGYGPVAWGYVVVQAVGGLLIAAVVKYADNILKAFATSVAIIVVSLISHFFFAFEPSGLFFVGGAGVVYAIFLYGDLLKDFAVCKPCPHYLGGPLPLEKQSGLEI